PRPRPPHRPPRRLRRGSPPRPRGLRRPPRCRPLRPPPGHSVPLPPPPRPPFNMTATLTVPTATSVRSVPAKLLIDNRIVINNHLARGRGGKVSFTHLIGFAMVRALRTLPEMNHAYAPVDNKPGVVTPNHVNLGLAIDVPGRDGTR